MQRLVPDIEIVINGKKIGVDRLIFCRVSYALDKADMFKLVFDDNDMKLQEDSLFKEGSEVIVKLGYSRKFTKMIEGEAVRIDYDFVTKGQNSITLIGFDKSFRLNRTKHSRSFLKVKDSDIARKIAGEMGLKAEITPTNQVHEYVFQNNQSNLDFLKMRAKRIDFEVEVEDDTLIFKKARHSERKDTVILKWDKNLIEFHPKIDITKVVDEIEIRGWDPKSKKAVVGKAKAGDETNTFGTIDGAKVAVSKYGSSTSKSFRVNTPLTTQEEANEMAKARLNQLNMNYLTGEGVCIGEPKIRAGRNITIEGVGKKVSGEYYITSAEHVFAKNGYRTYFEFKRNVGR